MKFRIFTLHEIIYKWVAYLSVVFISIASVVYYVLSNNYSAKDKPLLNSDELTFILSVLYALFLFVITVYLTSMSDRIRNMFNIRKEQYRQLKKLSEVYKVEGIEERDKDRELLSFLFMCQAFTGRTEKEEMKPYIKQKGFSYTNRYLRLEKSFIEQHSKLQIELNDRINNYINARNLKKTVVNVFILERENFFTNVDSWINNRLDLDSDQIREFHYFVDRLRLDLKKKIKRLKKTEKKLMENNVRISKKAKTNIIRLERVYGEKLIESINAEVNFVSNLQVLENLINELKSKMLTYDDMQEIAEEQFLEVHEYLNNINSKLETMNDNLIEKMDSEY
ncbi:hypothetical protein LG275_13800 (plasmid) [Chryseomicrobium palamuruense]